MFSKKEEGASSPKTMNQLGSGTSIVGNIESDADIRIDGKLHGNVYTKSKLVLGLNAIIEGDVICVNGYIEGKINGNVECSDLLILSKTAFVSGDIVIKKLVVEEGAKFNGRCTMGVQVARNTDGVETTTVKSMKQA